MLQWLTSSEGMCNLALRYEEPPGHWVVSGPTVSLEKEIAQFLGCRFSYTRKEILC